MNANRRTRHRARLLCLLTLCGTVSCAGGEVYGQYSYVEVAPPPPRVELVAVSPGPDYVWIDGHWAWRGQEYLWEPGRWEAKASGHRGWHKGEWKHARQGWYWQEGHWR
jgi:YXWGXW repeat-containing protein